LILDNEELEELLGVYRLDFAVSIFPERNYEEIEMTTDNLWTLICYLFLRHFAANKTAFCVNPDCISPYFLKRRRDQRFCELGPCTRYAQREYTRKWWHLKGKTRRAKKHGKSPRRKRQ